MKGNQKTVYYEVKEYFTKEGLRKEIMSSDGRYRKETEETIYHTVTREYFITDDIKWFENRKDWEKLDSIGYERKTTARKGTDEIIIVARKHWHIENNLHWT